MKKSVWAALGLVTVWGLVVSVSAQTVAKALLAADLEYVVETVSEVHPAFVEAGRGEALADRADALLQALPDEVPRWRVGVTVAELLREANDGHTNTDMTFGSSRYLTLNFEWLSDGLVVAPVAGARIAIPVASKVLEVGKLDIATVEDKLSRLIPESRYWVRAFGDDKLLTESVLRWLGVVEKETVSLTLRTPSGQRKTIEVDLTGYGAGTSSEMQRLLLQARGLGKPWRVENDLLAWRVDARRGYGFFWLRRCENTPLFRSELKRFFRALQKSDVKNAVFSVQQNGGGTTAGIDVILGHLPERPSTVYAGRKQRHSELAESLNGSSSSRQNLAQNSTLKDGDLYVFRFPKTIPKRRAPLYSGNVVVLTDNATYSSGADLAVTFSDEHFAVTAGEPTGGIPSSHGDYVEAVTPNLNIPFRVSTTFWIRSDPTRDPADTLTPDIPLPVTVKDVQTGHSPVLRWLESLNRPQSAIGQ